jgi:hypothetical protein
MNHLHSRNSENGIDPVLIQKMVFIYNALNDGWDISKKGENRYEFKKNIEQESEEIKREINLDDYLKKFLKMNLSLENLHQRRRGAKLRNEDYHLS